MNLLTRAEAAKYLRVSKSWLSERAKQGKPPAFIKMGGKVFYLQDSLDAFVFANLRIR